MLVDHTLDPHIHGGTLHTAIGKQGYAVGHLDAHAVLLHQSFQQPGIGQGFQRGKVQRSRCNRLGGSQNIRGAVAQRAVPQCLLPCRGERLRRWERIQHFPARLQQRRTVPGTQRFHASLNGRDIFALADDKGNQHLPGVLAQNADARPGPGRCAKIGILFGHRGADGRIIAVQIKIAVPEALPFFRGTASCIRITAAGLQVQKLIPCQKPPALRRLRNAERLAAGGYFLQIEIIRYRYDHGSRSTSSMRRALPSHEYFCSTAAASRPGVTWSTLPWLVERSM